MERAVKKTIEFLMEEVKKHTGREETVRIDTAVFCDIVEREFAKRKVRPKKSGRRMIQEIHFHLTKKLGYKGETDHFRSYVDITPTPS